MRAAAEAWAMSVANRRRATGAFARIDWDQALSPAKRRRMVG
jgi:hypothetical protein